MSASLSATLDDTLRIAGSRLLEPAGLTPNRISGALDRLLGNDADYADLYFQTAQTESWTLDDGKVSAGGFGISEGVGVRAVCADQTGFAYSSVLSSDAITAAISSVRGMIAQGQDACRLGGASIADNRGRPPLYTMDNPIEAWTSLDKLQLLQELDRCCREADPRIVQVTGQLNVSHANVVVVDSDGTLSADVRPMVELSANVIADNGQRRAKGTAAAGGRVTLDDIKGERLDRLVATAVRMALVNLDARPAPSGAMSVVLGNGFPGVLLHEAVGHGLEADAHRKNTSVFAGRMGEMIAARGVTVIDDGTLAGHRGSLNIDDEGVPSARNVLIENGRLVGLMQDRTNARLLGRRPTGNGRRQGYSHLPMPRMTNTFLAPGSMPPEEIIGSVRKGIYAVSFGGGRVDITSGQFNFSAIEAYLIEDGRVTAPISGATLIGLGHEALDGLVMVGDDLQLGNGVCGKEGQSVPVCVGQPTVRIDGMVVGGTS